MLHGPYAPLPITARQSGHRAPHYCDVTTVNSASRQVEVSILVPSFNSGPYLIEAIRSALDQHGVNLEVVIQDGGSMDKSLATVAGVGDPRLLLTTEPDGGQSDFLNRALRRATGGEFVVWLNADDLLEPGALAELLRAARERNLDVVHGNFEIIDADGESSPTAQIPTGSPKRPPARG